MPRDKRDPAARKPSPYEGAGSEAINAMVTRVAPAILDLLGDGVPRTKAIIVGALAWGRSPAATPRTTSSTRSSASPSPGKWSTPAASTSSRRPSRDRARSPSPVAEPHGMERKSRER